MSFPYAFDFECPVKTHCGDRCLEHLPFELRATDAAKPLVIADKDASTDGRSRAVINAFRDADVTLGVVEGIPEADPETIAPHLAAIYRDKDCDAVVAVGGGRFIDTAKWLNLMLSTGQDSFAVFAEGLPVPRELAPLAVVPPAAADGFELSGHLRSERSTVRSVHLMPKLLLLDPRTAGEPEDTILVGSALVALTNGAESFFGSPPNPMTAVYARTAVRLATDVLHQLAHYGTRDERLALTTAHAAALSGCALGASPLATTQRLGHAVAELGDVSAAQSMGILLSYVLEYRTVSGRLDAVRLLELLGGPDRYARTPSGQRGAAALYFLRNLLNLLFDRTDGRVKRTLQDLGLSSETLADAARKMQSAEGEEPDDAKVILAHAHEGRPFLEFD